MEKLNYTAMFFGGLIASSIYHSLGGERGFDFDTVEHTQDTLRGLFVMLLGNIAGNHFAPKKK
jgi:hypothetical protein